MDGVVLAADTQNFIDLEKITEYCVLLLWEADSLPIKKISFFNNNQPSSCGSLMEFHSPYFATKNTTFKTLSSCYYAYTVNFIAASKYKILNQKKFYITIFLIHKIYYW